MAIKAAVFAVFMLAAVWLADVCSALPPKRVAPRTGSGVGLMATEKARSTGRSRSSRQLRTSDFQDRLWRSYAASPGRKSQTAEDAGDSDVHLAMRRRLNQQLEPPDLSTLEYQPLGLGPSMNLSETRLPVSERQVPQLYGSTVLVRMVEVFPFALRNGAIADGYTGFFADLLDEMGKQLNVTFEFAEPSSDAHFLEGAIDDVSSGLADVLVGPVGLVEVQDNDNLILTNSFLNTGLVLLGALTLPASSSKVQASSLYSWTQPFEWRLWLVTLFMIIAFGVVMRLLEPNPEPPEEGGAHGMWQSLWLSFLTFAGQLVGHVPGTLAGRFFHISASFTSVILISSYTANIVPILTSQQTTLISINSLEEAALSSLPICVADASTGEHYVKNAFPNIPLIKVTGSTTEEEILNTFAMLQNGTCEGVVMDEFIAAAHLASSSEYCNITQVGNIFAKTTYVMALRNIDPQVGPEEAELVSYFVDAAAHFFTQISEDGSLTTLILKHLVNDGTQCNLPSTSVLINTQMVLGPVVLFAAAALACFVRGAFLHLGNKGDKLAS